MKTLHFDCFAGISGDMALGAFVDLGVDPGELKSALGGLNIKGWKLDFVKDERCGIRGTRALVDVGDHAHGHGHNDYHEHHEHGEHHAHNEDDHHEHHAREYGEDDYHGHHEHGEGDYHRHHGHEHSHGEGDHHHAHGEDDHHEHHKHGEGDYHEHGGHHEHEHGEGDHHHAHEHAHNSWKEIRGLIENSALGDGVKTRALDIFLRIASAESQVHGVPLDDIAFHEVGALDSIIDIVGAAVCLDLLKPQRITAGTVELGGGTVRCAHGILPVPAPATLKLCSGMPVHTGGFDREMTTPTGAAILASCVDEFAASSSFREITSAYGIGVRQFDKPNVLRLSWREEDEYGDWIHEELTLLETNIDDLSGEELGFAMERLFDAGALDVTMTPCIMKKSRPGTTLQALCKNDALPSLHRMFFNLAAIGFKETKVLRHSLRREELTLRGEREFRVKRVFLDGGPLREKIEADDRAAFAKEKNISLAKAGEILYAGINNKEKK